MHWKNTPNLTLFQQAADDLIVENDHCLRCGYPNGLKFRAKAVVLTVGTFLGEDPHWSGNFSGGRWRSSIVDRLADRLRELPFRVDRFKTGTPPRIDARCRFFTARSATRW